MKTRTVVLKLDLPASPEELLRGLHNLSDDPEVAAAERVAAAAEDALSRAREEVRRLDADASSIRDAVSGGRAGTVQFEAALAATRQAAAFVLPAERAVERARVELTRAQHAARDRALQAANERIANLLKVDSAVVAQMNAIDEMMDALTFRLYAFCSDQSLGRTDQKYDQRGRTGELPDRAQAMLNGAANAHAMAMMNR